MSRLPRFTVSRVSIVMACAGVVACSDNDPVNPGGPADVTTCSTSVTTGDAFVELCALTEPVRHVRIENIKAGRTHASAQILFGSSTTPTATSGDIGDNQFRVLFYGGGTPAPSPILQASFEGANATFDGNATFINSGVSVCFDLHNGTATTAPRIVLWIDGQNGANCANRSTLTTASAFAAQSTWNGSTGSIATDAKIYFRQSASGGTTPKVTLSAEPVLDAATIASATTCTTTWSANTDWQQLCTPAIGSARHVRIENVQSTANNSYFYAVFGQDAAPTGNPAGGEGKMIITGGRSHAGASWTWFRFGSESTTQFSYATSAPAALYTDAPTSICFDTSDGSSGNAQLVFWATGANGADCAVRSTLTLDRALYNSATAETSAMWNAPLASGKLNFVKTNNASVSLGSIVVSSEPAAH